METEIKKADGPRNEINKHASAYSTHTRTRRPESLKEWAEADLEKSGLTPDTFTIQLSPGGDFEGYKIIYPNAPDFSRLKLRYPKEGGAKYLSDKGSGNQPYIPFDTQKALESGDSTALIFITEGEKKAAKATLENSPCIGLTGVYGWKDKRSGFLPELEAINWKGRRVYIVFDSDAVDNPNVREAEKALAVELRKRGAEVFIIRLPGEPDGEKTGFDDYLVRHGAEKFKKLIEKARNASKIYPGIEQVSYSKKRLKPVSARDLPEIEQPESLWGGFLYPGCITQLNAEPGAGKSTIAYNLAALGAQGKEFAGEVFSGPLTTLYVDLETPTWLRTLKIEAICGERPESFYLLDELHLSQDIDELIPICMADKYDLIVLDTQSKVFGLQDENDNSQATRAATLVTQLAKETGAGILLIHHTSKGGNTKKVYSGRGASAIAGSVDIVANLEVLDPNTVNISVAKSRIPAEFRSITLRKIGDDRFERVASEETGARLELYRCQDFIINLLSDGMQHRTGEIVAKGGMQNFSERTVKRALAKLKSVGKITMVRQGVYVLSGKLADSNAEPEDYPDVLTL